MWLHIDGAYGAGLAFLPECKWVGVGWSEADSLVINPHKMLFVPLDFSALYVRDVGRLRRLFALTPEHVHLRDPIGAEINYMDYGQLGRRFRALKAWVVWRAFGRDGLAARIRDHLRLAKLFADWIQEDKRFELSAPVMMGVVCFRCKVGGGHDEKIDIINRQIVERINASGRAYLTQTNAANSHADHNVLTHRHISPNVWE
jgi:aromatic-L-amino-acid decarboxylase